MGGRTLHRETNAQLTKEENHYDLSNVYVYMWEGKGKDDWKTWDFKIVANVRERNNVGRGKISWFKNKTF